MLIDLCLNHYAIPQGAAEQTEEELLEEETDHCRMCDDLWFDQH